ncbi:hypothetical protein [Microtetraspora niveoalba]|uniref:hypothetical protein n=1 Tax=Microtetraspora niveoalba TaxID=46175 RepID=UPI0012F91033|nr:hypothetical protein [Microtetraspora niveoalba]
MTMPEFPTPIPPVIEAWIRQLLGLTGARPLASALPFPDGRVSYAPQPPQEQPQRSDP